MTMTYEEEVWAEAEKIRAGDGPPIQWIKHWSGECQVCDALRLIEDEDVDNNGEGAK